LWQETLRQNILPHGLPDKRGENLKEKATYFINETYQKGPRANQM
jgi:hypothetical protein